jgi:hypothetical protein
MADQRTSLAPTPLAPASERAGTERVGGHHVLEGVRTGCVGATAVWLWLAVIDAIERTPFRTSALMGRGLLSIEVVGDPHVPAPGHFSALAGVAAFTVVHYALWIGLGTLAVRAVRAAARTPAVLVLAINLTIGLQVAFAVFAGMMAADGMGAQAWRAVFAGSLVGSAATWWYLVRQHPEMRAQYARAADDDHG